MALVLPLAVGCGLAGRIGDRVAGKERYRIPSEAMEPTIRAGSSVTAVAPEEGYVPKSGDVIVFRVPASWGGPGLRVSRIIGVPGATVACCDDQGRTLLNGRSLQEPYIKEPPASRLDFGPVTVPPGHVWVQGDNRHVSLDSRSRAGAGDSTVPVSGIVGIVDSRSAE
ncbi:signal peptidase I [Streptosporangium carneum]|nr:signal peptidase I [Streptosporangium carneum]